MVINDLGINRLITSIMIMATIAIGAHAEVVFYESFNNLQGNGGNDGYFDNSADQAHDDIFIINGQKVRK